MRIYVGTYGKYNSGSIAGAWLNIADYSDKEEFHKACAELHKGEHDPEFMFQDWESIPAGMISESHVSEDLFEFAQFDEDDREMLSVYREHVNQGGTLEDVQGAFVGKYEQREDYAYQLYEDMGDLEKIPQTLLCHIDWDSVARDMEWNGDVTFVDHEGECWVFLNH